MSGKGYTPIQGSERAPMLGAREIGAPDPSERIEVTLRLRPRSSTAAIAEAAERATRGLGERQYLSREAYENTHGTDPADIMKIEEFAHDHDLDVVEASAPRRSVMLGGTVAAFKAAFGVELKTYEHASGTYRGRTGAVHVPDAIADIVEGVFGLDDRPQAKPHFRWQNSPDGAASRAVGSSFTPPQLAKLYNFPAGATGAGQTIAIIELGGGSRSNDLKAYFTKLGIHPAPKVTSVSVDGGHSHPTTPNSADGEVMLDIEVAGAVAPGARIAVYYAPNTDRGFLDAITKAIHDTVRKPSVISISWGASEPNWTPQAMQAFDQAFQAAAAMGVTVTAASGDDGSTDGAQDGKDHVDFPASSPFVLACGGTRVMASGTTITQEKVWNNGPGNGATGGGISQMFPRPSYQANISLGNGHNGRFVPDISADADPETGYLIRVDGQEAVIGGTSAVAPLWAGLVALMNEKRGHPVGFMNPLLYQLPANSGALHDITQGDNGTFHARPGYDACTGLGSPNGEKLLQAL